VDPGHKNEAVTSLVLSILLLMMVLEVSANAVREFSTPCSNHDNSRLMMWAKAQDKKLWSTKQTKM